MGSGILIGTLVVLVALSAYFSATETAFSSLNRIRIKNMASDGDKRAQLVLNLSQDYDKLLSTILIGNNIVNITSASLATVLFVGWLGDAGVSLSTVIMTVVVLVFGEISPKSLAKESPEKFAMLSAPVMRVLIVLFTPLNFLFSQWKRLLSRVFHTDDSPGMTEEELLTIVEEAQQEGGIDEQESELIRSAIGFNDLKAVDIFTPRVDVTAVSKEATLDEIADTFADTGYSRLPVYDESIDDIVGIIHHKDFFNDVVKGGRPLDSVIKPATFITQSIKIAELLRMLQKNKSHMAVITDEFGGTVGIVTMEDILEELVGEIWDEHDEVVEPILQLSEDTYRIVGSEELHKVEELFDLDDESEASTVGGWVLERMGRIPQEGDAFEYGNLAVTVTKTDARRVLEILVRRVPEAEDAQAAAQA